LSRIEDRFRRVRDRIGEAARRVGRAPDEIALCAVTKTVGLQEIREVVAAGATILGESRVQEAAPKIEGAADVGAVVEWARANAERNGLAAAPVRWIVEDAARFAARELRREAAYDAIVLDPPSFGRGPKGEVWKIEKDLDPLLAACRKLLSGTPRFVLVTAHPRAWKPRDLARRLDRALAGTAGKTEAGPLELRAAGDGVLRSGVFAWRRLDV